MGFGYTERGFVMPWYKTVTASGNPVTLEAAKRLRQLTIYGNAVQNGTPSPDAPVEVQLCGDATGNLYDVNDKYGTWNTAVTDDAGWITVNYDNTEGTSGSWPSLYTNFRDVIEPSTEYTVVTEIEYISGCAVHPNTTGSPKSAFNILFSYTQQGTHYMTVTSESDLSDCVTLLRSNYLVEPGNIGSAKFRISLFKGSYTAETIPAYEPYGYKVSGRVEGMNLFDKDNATLGYRLTQDGVLYNDDSAAQNSFVSDYISVDPNTIYSLNYSITDKTPATGYERVCFYDTDKQYISKAKSEVHTFTTPENALYLRLCRLQTHLDDTMLLKGSYTADTIPPYEPYQPPQEFAVYLPQQIAKVGDVADTVVVDFEQRTAELVQNGWVKTFYGTENFGSFVTSVGNGFSYTNSSIYSSNHKDVISNMYTTSYGSFDHSVYVDLTRVNFIDNSFQTANEFKEWVADLYAAGDPLICLLRYATPVTTDITAMQDWDAMPQVKGTVTLTLSAEVPPSGAEAVYISSRSPKPKAQTISDVVINEADPEHTEASEPEQADEAAALNIEMITYE